MTPEAEPKKDDAKPAAPGDAAPAASASKPAPADGKAPETAPPKPPAPRYRYFTVAPATVRLPVDDLTALLPDGAWVGTDADKRRELALPTAEILEKNFPRIRFSRLSDLLPGCIRSVENAPEWIVLPTDRIALAYRPETRRELLSEAQEKPAPAAATPTSEPSAQPEAAPRPIPAWKRLLKPILAPPPEPAKAEEKPSAPEAGTKAVETPPVSAPAPTPPAEPVAPTPAPKPVPLADLRVAPEAEARLQQALMTDEALPVSRLIALGGALPSLQGLVLRRGDETVRSSEFLAPVDAATLADGAKDILAKIGETSGLHFKPAITLYAESGPISFLRQGPLQLVVLHRERAFLPGVREKLEAILEAIAQAS